MRSKILLTGMLGFFSAYNVMAWDTDLEASVKWLSANISPLGAAPGTVIASPSREHPDYYYHWVRDAGLVMSTWLDVYHAHPARAVRDRVEKNLYDYWRLTMRHQNQQLPGGLGEVKFHVNGDVFRGPWGRPQNDGPAIRALSLMQWREHLKQKGDSLYQHSELYASSLPAMSAIKRDLEYVAHTYYHTNADGSGHIIPIAQRSTDFDVWEEVRGHHFFNRLFQMYALRKGAELSREVGDRAHTFYTQIADQIQEELNWHWDEGRGYIESTVYRSDGIWYKSGLDSAAIIAVLETKAYADLAQGTWTVLDSRVQATVQKLSSAFAEGYKINHNSRAPLIGRYPEDTYNGVSTDSRGNPWFLTTHYIAEFYYELAAALDQRGEVQITAASRAFWSDLGLTGVTSLRRGDDSWQRTLQALVARGDGTLAHVSQYVGPFGNMPEQINRDSGGTGIGEGGAQDLSWSYSSYIRAALARDRVAHLKN